VSTVHGIERLLRDTCKQGKVHQNMMWGTMTASDSVTIRFYCMEKEMLWMKVHSTLFKITVLPKEIYQI